jgi:hypothetical protein
MMQMSQPFLADRLVFEVERLEIFVHLQDIVLIAGFGTDYIARPDNVRLPLCQDLRAPFVDKPILVVIVIVQIKTAITDNLEDSCGCYLTPFGLVSLSKPMMYRHRGSSLDLGVLGHSYQILGRGKTGLNYPSDTAVCK